MSFGLFASFADGANLYQVLCSDAACRGSRTAATTKNTSRNFMVLLRNKQETIEMQLRYDEEEDRDHMINAHALLALSFPAPALRCQSYDVIIIERDT